MKIQGVIYEINAAWEGTILEKGKSVTKLSTYWCLILQISIWEKISVHRFSLYLILLGTTKIVDKDGMLIGITIFSPFLYVL